ncbi:Hemoglobinase-type cysteine proteinase [Trichostrongylus colubriformis]|uniref:legumain n=1 Tax=Trichostrongylus colubriformis TaxID=6319 RepID=A0AAN8IMJ7_TRICO
MKILSLLFSLVLLSFSRVVSSRHHRQPAAQGEIHALLVAGSNGWYNYRHQADVGHAYHTLKRHGLADENIIVMMYDDVANNKQNPYPGKLFNRPHGENVYEGLKIDYKGSSVTPENFLNILKGNASGVEGGNGRVIESNPNDRIFVFFTDHGAVGLIAFPDEMLTVKELNKALNWMHSNERYDQLVFYLEACESGSMFENVLKSNINVYAITAANSHESSWGTFCENDMRLPCLGDLFSVNWMKDSDEEDLNVETLEDQYKLVKRMTNLSHVMHFGDMHIANEPVGWFQGQRKSHRKGITDVDEEPYSTVSWPSRDVELLYLHQLKETTNDIYEAKELSRSIRKIHEDRRKIKSMVLNLVDNLVETLADRRRMFEERNTVEDLDCHHDVVRAFDLICVDVNKYDYALKYIYVLNNLCIELGDAEQIITAMWSTCSKSRFQFF